MNEKHLSLISSELNIAEKQVRATAALIADGSTVPFIARYRKEVTGSLDEVAITAIRDKLTQLAELDDRKASIIKSLTERELLTDELSAAIAAAKTLTVLEDIYLPYRPKRRTRATIAKEKGLEPLAMLILEQRADVDPIAEAKKFISEEKEVGDEEAALAGARDIIAEIINEDSVSRKALRTLFAEKGIVESKVVKGKDKEGAKYRDYFEWQESIAKAAGHRVLAMFRGEKEGFLRLSVRPPEGLAISILDSNFVKGDNDSSKQVRIAVEDSYGRLLSWSMETEIRVETKKKVDREAIMVFSMNLRDLLMAAPLGQKAMLAIDPGFRTGCKVVCLDPQGKLLHFTTIFPTQSQALKDKAAKSIGELCKKHAVEAIAIGNGTASRETESFVRGLKFPETFPIVIVNESGASIYSASEVAREEFPDQDITVRGSVSIGRRLMDPLAELVKLDPKSIGVGQYQHDVNQTQLKDTLSDVVVSCVNAVGVEINTASHSLLAYVSGLGPTLAKAIVKYRDENGAFKSRKEVKKVPRLGPKAFEQAAGFLRIGGSKNPLDGSAVHPESYAIVEKMAKDHKCSVSDLMQQNELRQQIELENYITEKVGRPTLEDIMYELARPGRDPRSKFEAVKFAEGVHSMQDLTPGMKLNGIVTNVTKFGAFVDIGVHQDGLVHISQLADQFVKNPMDVVSVQQKVLVKVMSVDIERRRIALSMKSDADSEKPKAAKASAKPASKKPKPTPQKPKSDMALALEKALKSK